MMPTNFDNHHSTDCLTTCWDCLHAVGHARFGCIRCDPIARGETCGHCGIRPAPKEQP